ncbi:hypothetical protein TNIN_175471 [Trichonephila inaurata madagascariensis]|uniref:Uncharacterized protein n=1 Tax=Trichonephila inaurata madagascariensis TaxID=2747483 RepID=A0A8X7CRW9_9ARAC|nr:hypothetical protein TNIN_175471 [Trichonephila inaurata madagascariensis]
MSAEKYLRYTFLAKRSCYDDTAHIVDVILSLQSLILKGQNENPFEMYPRTERSLRREKNNGNYGLSCWTESFSLETFLLSDMTYYILSTPLGE